MLLIVKQPDLGTALVLAGVTAMMLLLAGVEMKFLCPGVSAALPPLAALLFWSPGAARACWRFLNPDSIRRAQASTSTSPSSPSVPAASWAAATWKACRSSSTSPKLLQILFMPTSPKNWASSAPCLSSSSSRCSAIADCAPPSGPRYCLRASPPSGLTTAILLQAFFNISVVLSLLPTKGIPLPFISSGGTKPLLHPHRNRHPLKHLEKSRLTSLVRCLPW